MKTIIKVAIVLAIVVLARNTYAQEFTTETGSAKKIVITDLFGKIDVKEIAGSTLKISVEDLEDIEIPDKAKGLQPVAVNGSDNTKIGLNVENKGNLITVKGTTKRTMEGKYLFQVPKGVSISIDYKSPFTYGNIDIEGLSSEVEINTMNDDINLKNVTGPLVLHSINGSINVNFSTINQQSPISITSINGDIDLTMPASTPANLNMSTMHGEIYTNFDIAFDKEEKEGLKFVGGGNKMEGTINAGGVELTLRCINDNIYLRKK